MSVVSKLASALNRRDEVPNQELAKEIVRAKDKGAVKELVENLATKTSAFRATALRSFMKLVNEPKLIAPYFREFAALLDSKNNRLVWGAVTALDAITLEEPQGVYSLLARVLEVADSGSIITRDHAVGILIKLGTLKQYSNKCIPLLLEQLLTCPANQFPMYAEMSLILVSDKNRAALQKVVTQRLGDLEKESQKKRVAKVLKRL